MTGWFSRFFAEVDPGSFARFIILLISGKIINGFFSLSRSERVLGVYCNRFKGASLLEFKDPSRQFTRILPYEG